MFSYEQNVVIGLKQYYFYHPPSQRFYDKTQKLFCQYLQDVKGYSKGSGPHHPPKKFFLHPYSIYISKLMFCALNKLKNN